MNGVNIFEEILNSKITKIVLSLTLIMSIILTSLILSDNEYADASNPDSDFTVTATNNAVTITKYVGTSTDVVIPDYIQGVPVTTIATSAFASKLLTSVDIPNTVTTIGNNAFKTNKLTKVTIPNSVTSIGTSAFESNSLTDIQIPSSVIEIGSYAFRSNLLTSVTFSEGIETIGTSAFVGVTGGTTNNITSLVLPNSLTKLGGNAFQFNKITSLTLGNGLSDIPTYAFASNTLTGHLIIPEGVSTIGTYAFDAKNQITGLTLPSTLTKVDSYAFRGNLIPKIEFKQLKSPTGSTVISTGAFANNTPLTEVYFPVTVSTATASAFLAAKPALPSDLTIYGYDSVPAHQAVATTNKNNYVSLTTLGDGITPNEDNEFIFTTDAVSATISNYRGKTTNVVIPDTLNGMPVGTISSNSFKSKGLTSVKIPRTVTFLGTSAFEDNLLTDIKIPEGVTSLGSRVFSTNKLVSVEFPSTLTSLGISTFESNRLDNINLPASLKTISTGTFNANKLSSVTLPHGMTSVGLTSFANNSLTDVIVPTSITTLGTTAFDGNQLIPSNLRIHGYENPATAKTFASSKTFTFVSLGDSYIPPQENPESDFVYTTKDGEVSITDYVGTGKSVNIPSHIQGNPVTVLGTSSFYNKGLIAIKIPNTVKKLDSQAFKRNSLISLDLPNSLETIGNYAFEENQLASVIIPSNVIKIGNYAFKANKLVSVTLPDGLEDIGVESFMTNRLTTLDIPTSATKIGNGAFSYNEITSIKINKEVKNWGINIFKKNKITSVVIEDGVKELTEGMFASNLLTDVTIPPSVTLIGPSVFSGNQTNSMDLHLYAYDSPGAPKYHSDVYKHTYHSLGQGTLKGILEQHTGIQSKMSFSFRNGAVIDGNGDVIYWGDYMGINHADVVIPTSNSPMKATGFPKSKAVKVTESSIYVIDETGQLYVWGKDFRNNGFLGLGDITEAMTPTPIPGMDDVVAIESKRGTNYAITGNGDLYSWGQGYTGHSTNTTPLVPTKVQGVSNVIGVSTQGSHTLALTGNGILYSWGGNNSYGELGRDSHSSIYNNYPTPGVVNGISDVSSISTGQKRSFAINSNGDMYGWGSNDNQELGSTQSTYVQTGSFINDYYIVHYPIKITGQIDMKYVGASEVITYGVGSVATVSVTNDNKFKFWKNSSKQFETRVKDVVGVEVGEYDDGKGNHYTSYMAVTANGEVCTWGSNTYGQLGVGDTSTRQAPTCLVDVSMNKSGTTPPVSPPAIPPVNPPSDGGGGGGGGGGSSTIETEVLVVAGELTMGVPDINNFNRVKLDKDTQEVYTNFTGNVKVSDARGSDQGWRLSLQSTEFKAIVDGQEQILPTGRLKFTSPTSITEAVTGSSDGLNNHILTSQVELDGLGPMTVASADIGYGQGITNVDFDLIRALSLTLDPNEISVDKLNVESTYTATLTWSLTEAP